MLQSNQIAKVQILDVADSPGGAPGTIAAAEHAANHESVFGLDSYAVVAIAFFVFVAILWKVGAFRMIGQSLDQQAERVRADLAEAAQLRAEAEQVRAKAAAEAQEAQQQAQATLANAEAEAKRIIEQATVDAETQINRHIKLAEDRIAAEARTAEAELRTRAAEVAVEAAKSLLGQRSSKLGALTDSAIAGLDAS